MVAAPRSILTLALATVVAGVTGCFTTAADFRENAEGYIVDGEDLRAALLEDGDTFVSATCADPQSQDVGTTFACTARDSTDGAWEFEIEITGSHEYEVTDYRRPDDG